MTNHNLFSPSGYALNYPHTPFWNEKTNVVGIVTNPSRKVVIGDIVFVATEQKLADGGIAYGYFQKPHTVVEILEERKAKGNHQVKFTPIFQNVKVELIKE